MGSSAIEIKLTTTLESYVSYLTQSRSYLIEINHENKRAMTHLSPFYDEFSQICKESITLFFYLQSLQHSTQALHTTLCQMWK